MADFPGSGKLPVEHPAVNDHLAGDTVGYKKIGKGLRGNAAVKQIRADRPGADIIFHNHRHTQPLTQLGGQIMLRPSRLKGGIDHSGTAVDESRQADTHSQQFFGSGASFRQEGRDFPAEQLKCPVVRIQNLSGMPTGKNIALKIRQNIVDPVGAHIHTADMVSAGHKFQHYPGTPGTFSFLRSRRGGVPEQAPVNQRVDNTGDRGRGQAQLLGNLHSGNRAVLIDKFLNQVIVVSF